MSIRRACTGADRAFETLEKKFVKLARKRQLVMAVQKRRRHKKMKKSGGKKGGKRRRKKGKSKGKSLQRWARGEGTKSRKKYISERELKKELARSSSYSSGSSSDYSGATTFTGEETLRRRHLPKQEQWRKFPLTNIDAYTRCVRELRRKYMQPEHRLEQTLSMREWNDEYSMYVQVNEDGTVDRGRKRSSLSTSASSYSSSSSSSASTSGSAYSADSSSLSSTSFSVNYGATTTWGGDFHGDWSNSEQSNDRRRSSRGGSKSRRKGSVRKASRKGRGKRKRDEKKRKKRR